MNQELQKLLSVLGEKWSIDLIRNLRAETLGFSDLKRRVPGVSQRMLAQSLRHLSDARIVRREVLSTSPPRVNYSLTAEGDELFHMLLTFGDQAQKFGLLSQTQ